MFHVHQDVNAQTEHGPVFVLLVKFDAYSINILAKGWHT